MDDLARSAVNRRPRLTDERLRQLELAFAQAWIKQPLLLDGLKLVEELRRARAALTKLGARTGTSLAMRGNPGRGEGADELLNTLDTIAEGLGFTEEERASAPA